MKKYNKSFKRNNLNIGDNEISFIRDKNQLTFELWGKRYKRESHEFLQESIQSFWKWFMMDILIWQYTHLFFHALTHLQV